MSVFKAISQPAAGCAHALRWYKHIASFSEAKLASLPGKFETLAAAASAPAEAPAKKEKAAPKEAAPKKEKAPKE